MDQLKTNGNSSIAKGARRGALVFLLPGIITDLAYSALMAGNTPSFPNPYGPSFSSSSYHVVRDFSFVYYLLFLLPCLLCGAGIGRWIGSSLPVPDVKKGAMGGAFVAFLLSIFMSAIWYNQLESLSTFLFFVIFLGVVLCGAYGGAQRQRNNHAEDDKNLFAQLGVGLLSMFVPIIGLPLALVLFNKGSDKANSALGGAVFGAVFLAAFYINAATASR